MAVIHITEEEAARDLHALLDKITPELEIRIARGYEIVAIIKSPASAVRRKTLSEAIEAAEKRNSQVLLDDQWSNDLETVVRSHEHETLINPWE